MCHTTCVDVWDNMPTLNHCAISEQYFPCKYEDFSHSSIFPLMPFSDEQVLEWVISQIHVEVVADCRGPHLLANKLHWDTRTSPTGLPLACAPCCNSGQTFPDPIAAGGCAHQPTTTAHYSETLKGGLGGCGGRWGGGGQMGTGALLWHSSPLFSSCPIHTDPLLLCQSSGTFTLPGPLGQSRTKTYLTFHNHSQKSSMWHPFQLLKNDTHWWPIAVFLIDGIYFTYLWLRNVLSTGFEISIHRI